MKYQRIAYQGSFHHPVGGKFEMTTSGTFVPIVQSFKQRKSKIAVDYNHQLESASGSADDKIAAGWIDDLKIMNGDLYAAISWTEQAKKRIESQEYRYVSPAIIFDGLDNTGKKIPARLSTLGLVNKPFLSLLDPVQASDGSIAVCCNEISAAEIAELAAVDLSDEPAELITLDEHNEGMRVMSEQLHDANTAAQVAEARNTALESRIKLMTDRADDALVEDRFQLYRESRKLGPNAKKTMKLILASDPALFAAEYPPLPNNAPPWLTRKLSDDHSGAASLSGLQTVPDFSVLLAEMKEQNPTAEFDRVFDLTLARQATLMGAAA